MAALEVIALDTSVPQLMAPQAGDTYTFPRAVEMPLGTANGVLYLNGSKVVTSGSALVFDGSTLGVTRASAGTSASFAAGGQTLKIYGDSTSVSVGAGGALAYGTTATFYDPTNLAQIYTVNGTEQMRLTSTGLGIGTSSPVGRLNVEQSADGFDKGIVLTRVGANYGTIFLNASNDTLNFGRSGSTSMTLTTSGNLGLGVTPSAWGSSWRAVELAGGSLSADTGGTTLFAYQNTYFNGTSYIYKTTAAASYYSQNSGTHSWYTAPSGTAGNAISFTQAMTLDASGNLGIGVTSIQRRLHLGGGANDAGIKLSTDTSGNGNLDGADITFTTTNTLFITNRENGATVFETNGSERARITSGGNFVVGTAALATTATDGFLYVPTCAGTPTGTPTTQTGTAPIVVDTTNNKLYFYSGGQWRDAGP